MRVAAIMPTYNQAGWIEDAIASVAPQVDQLLIVDDGSTDETHGFLTSLDFLDARFQSRYIQTTAMRLPENGGTAKAINAGRLFANNEMDALTWVSSDNIMLPGWRSTLESAMADDVGVVYSGFNWVHRRRSIAHFTEHAPDKLINTLNCYYGPSFLIRREVWQEHRGKISHDYDNWLRVEEACWEKNLKIIAVNAQLCDYNAHDQRVTVTRRNQFDADHWQQVARQRRSGSPIMD